MADRYSIATGNASASGTWDSGLGVPVDNVDRVLICSGHTVTIDGTYSWGDDSTATRTINSVSTNAGVTVVGTLIHRITGNSQLTLNGGMNVNATGVYSIGTEANPVPTAYTAALLLNRSASLSDRKYLTQFVANAGFNAAGETKRKITTMTATAAAAATTIYVTDATGWKIADKLYISNTSDYSGDYQEERVIAGTYTPGSLTVPLTAALTNQHLNKCPIVNFTSNVTIKNHDDTYRGMLVITQGSASVADQVNLLDCSFENIGRYDDGGGLTFGSDSNFGTTAYPQPVKQLRRVACTSRTSEHALYMWYNLVGTVPVRCYEMAAISLTTGSTSNGLRDRGMGDYTDCLAAGATALEVATTAGTRFINGYVCGTVDNGNFINSSSRSLAMNGTKFSGPGRGALLRVQTGGAGPINMTVENADIGETFTRGYEVINSSTYGGAFTITLQNTHVGSLTAMDSGTQLSMVGSSYLKQINKNRDVTNQEEWYQRGKINRDNSVVTRSTSSLRMTPSTAGSAFTRSFTIAVSGNEVLRLIGYCRYDTTYYNAGTGFVAPTLVLSGTINGVTLTPVTYTAPSASAGTWDLIDKSITNTQSTAGEITVTLSTQCTPTTGNVYWDGIAIAPMVVAARHYGFVFDEANPKRIVNASISASFATADAYTGISITFGASLSTTALTASKTFQVLYDYSQAKGCQNIASAMPFSGAGVADNVSLTAAGAVTTTGYTLNGGGSLTMGAYVLTSSLPWVYTFTGGTFAQPTTVPSFTGGTLNIGAAGTFTFSGSSLIISMTPTAPSTYAMGAATFSGTIDLRNTAAHAITVQVPGGTTTTTASNTGGTITVSAPTVTQGLAFTGLIAGSQVKVFTTTTTTELFTTSSSGTSETWSQAGGSDTTVDYTIMKAGYVPIRVVGVTVNSAVLSTPISQAVDRDYAASSGLSWATASATPGTKIFALTAATTGQNWYSFMIESWIAQTTLRNVTFPLQPDGPASFTLSAGWEFTNDATLAYITRDGIRYTNTSGTRTAAWMALLTVGVPAGSQVRYQQTDGGTTVNATNTGNVDQLIKIYGDGSHGSIDYTGYLVIKTQREGYDQAEADVVGLYGTLSDQLFVVGLTPLTNGIATGDPALTLTIQDHGNSPVSWNGKTFSVTIIDNATPSTGTNILRELRYNFAAGGTYHGTDAFNWHDLAQVNASKFKTVRGAVYGDTGATSKGVRVVKNDGTTAHPDFDLYTADDGTTYATPVVADIAITNMTNVGAVPTRLQIINATGAAASIWQATTAYSLAAVRKRTTGIGTENTAGLYMRVTTAGTSAGTEPTWNTSVGGTTTDGSVTWTTYAVLFYDADPASTGYSTTYTNGNQFQTGETVTVRFAEMNAGTTFKRFSTSTSVASTGFSVDATPTADDTYATNGLDGSAYESTFSPNFTLNYIVLDTDTNFSGKSAYAYFCYTLTTSNGMYQFWGGVTALDAGNYRIESDVLNLYFDESAGFVRQTDDVRIFRKDGARPALDPTTGGKGIEINWRTPVNVVSTGGSALTPTESAYLLALPAAAATATAVLSAAATTPIAADIKKVNATTVAGAGTVGSPWGP